MGQAGRVPSGHPEMLLARSCVVNSIAYRTHLKDITHSWGHSSFHAHDREWEEPTATCSSRERRLRMTAVGIGISALWGKQYLTPREHHERLFVGSLARVRPAMELGDRCDPWSARGCAQWIRALALGKRSGPSAVAVDGVGVV